jgi:hypothetical protein
MLTLEAIQQIVGLDRLCLRRYQFQHAQAQGRQAQTTQLTGTGDRRDESIGIMCVFVMLTGLRHCTSSEVRNMGDNHTPSFLRKQESSVLADPAKSRWVPAFAGTTSCLQLTLCQSLLLQTKFPPFLTAVPT